MAVLTATQLARMRQRTSNDVVVNYVKAHINAALQATEDWFDKASTQSSLKADIDAASEAVTPSYTFTNNQAKKLVKYWLQDRFGRE